MIISISLGSTFYARQKQITNNAPLINEKVGYPYEKICLSFPRHDHFCPWYIRNRSSFITDNGFYLLTGFFWYHSSPKLNAKLIKLPAYQRYVTPFLEKRMSPRSKRRMFGMMGLVFLISALLIEQHLIRILLGVIYFSLVVGLSWYLKKRPTIKSEK